MFGGEILHTLWGALSGIQRNVISKTVRDIKKIQRISGQINIHFLKTKNLKITIFH